MKTINELKQCYYTELVPELTELESLRKKLSKKILFTAFVGLSLLIIPPLALSIISDTDILKHEAEDKIGVIYFFFVFLFSAFLYPRDLQQIYTKTFKDKIIEEIITFIDPYLTYDKEKHIPESDYAESLLFPIAPEKWDRFEGDDYVEGTVGKTNIRMSELHYKKRKSAGSSTTYSTIFKGLFFIADLDRQFSGHTIVLSGSATKAFGFFNMLTGTLGEQLKTGDPEFDKIFSVYGNNKRESNYILSETQRNRIVDFKRKTGKKIYISFTRSNVYVAVPYEKDLFEPKIFSTVLDFSLIKEYFEDIQLAISIVEGLDLSELGQKVPPLLDLEQINRYRRQCNKLGTTKKS
ncbi:MAG: DUF3137 domain-containing protein [Desulfobacteraceae bacterium]|nr:DUF3137 domain-containing protein [Desulfobacteraceae bacterium]